MHKILALAVGLVSFGYATVAQAQYYQRHGYQPRVHNHYYHKHRAPNWVPYVAGGLAVGALGAGYYYHSNYCWFERQPVYDNWGYYVGTRNVRICR